jgi:hypothetical protein
MAAPVSLLLTWLVITARSGVRAVARAGGVPTTRAPTHQQASSRLAVPEKSCYWYDGFDARDPPPGTVPRRNTGWDGVGTNCTKGPKSQKPCTAEDCCTRCQNPAEIHPQTGEACAFSIWNPTASACFFKTKYAVPFAKPGDVTCCPAGALACPSAPDGGPWHLLTDFSDEFPVSTNLKNVSQPYSILPLNHSKWNTNVRTLHLPDRSHQKLG